MKAAKLGSTAAFDNEISVLPLPANLVCQKDIYLPVYAAATLLAVK